MLVPYFLYLFLLSLFPAISLLQQTESFEECKVDFYFQVGSRHFGSASLPRPPKRPNDRMPNSKTARNSLEFLTNLEARGIFPTVLPGTTRLNIEIDFIYVIITITENKSKLGKHKIATDQMAYLKGHSPAYGWPIKKLIIIIRALPSVRLPSLGMVWATMSLCGSWSCCLLWHVSHLSAGSSLHDFNVVGSSCLWFLHFFVFRASCLEGGSSEQSKWSILSSPEAFSAVSIFIFFIWKTFSLWQEMQTANPHFVHTQWMLKSATSHTSHISFTPWTALFHTVMVLPLVNTLKKIA